MSRLELFSIRARVVSPALEPAVFPAQPRVMETSRSEAVMVERMGHLGSGCSSAARRSISRIGPLCWLLLLAAHAHPAGAQTVVPRDTTRRADSTRTPADTGARRPGDSLRAAPTDSANRARSDSAAPIPA